MTDSKIGRRDFIALAGTTAAGAALISGTGSAIGAPAIIVRQTPPFTLMKLPYADAALSPVVSANTIGFHYGKHHKGYVDKLNELVKGTEFESQTLDAIVKKTAKDKTKTAIFNNAAQTWNHNFYWNSLTPKGGGKPAGELAKKIDEAFGSFDKFRKEFADVTISQFGTGWGWLAADDKGKLKIVKTGDAEVPMTDGYRPLLTIDVWEHAYYLDYQNRRPDYVNAVIDKLLNWNFAAENLAKK